MSERLRRYREQREGDNVDREREIEIYSAHFDDDHEYQGPEHCLLCLDEDSELAEDVLERHLQNIGHLPEDKA